MTAAQTNLFLKNHGIVPIKLSPEELRAMRLGTEKALQAAGMQRNLERERLIRQCFLKVLSAHGVTLPKFVKLSPADRKWYLAEVSAEVLYGNSSVKKAVAGLLAELHEGENSEKRKE